MTIDESRFEIASSSTRHDLSNHTLIIPCVSIGSVPQLAIDALLEPNNATRIFKEKGKQIATLDHRFCVPFIGDVSQNSRGAKEDETVQGPLTLYSFPVKKVTILQQRSPVLKSRKHDFAQALMQWIAKRQFAEVVILTSLDAGLRTDAQMRHPFWYFSQLGKSSTKSSQIEARIKAMSLPKLEAAISDSSKLPAMPSGGLAKTYLQEAILQGISVHALITFAAEGDNRSDALAMAALLSELLGANGGDSLSQPLKEPRDWSLLFGSQANDSMFN